MKTSKKGSVFLAAIALAGVALSGAAHAADEVKLLSMFSGIGSKYGQTWQYSKFLAEVKNLSATQRVFMHFKKSNGTWADAELSYWRPSPNGKQIWRISNTDCNGDWTGCTKSPLELAGVIDHEFVLYVSANGQKFYDNNAGQNYKFNRNYGFALYNRDVYDWGQTSPTFVDNQFYGYAAVKNASVDAQVKVHYSSNGWVSEQVVDATKMYGYELVGYGGWPNPSAQGASGWSYSLPVDASVQGIEYAVEFVKNGVSLWDNNGGLNYKAKRSIATAIALRGTMNNWVPYGAQALGKSDYLGNVIFTGTVGFNGAGDDNGPDRFKFDASNDWTKSFGDNEGDGIADPNGADIKIKNGAGRYRITFAEVDRKYTVTKIPGNTPPVAKAGPDLTVGLGDTAKFDATASYDTDGSITNYGWDIYTAGVYVSSVRSTTPRGEFRFDQVGDFDVTLTVGDNKGDIGYDLLKVKVVPVVVNPKVKVTFECKNGTVTGTQEVYAVGGTAELGSWDLKKAVKLAKTAYPVWSQTLDMPASKRIEWKCLKKRPDNTSVVWQGGANNVVTTPATGSIKTTGSF